MRFLKWDFHSDFPEKYSYLSLTLPGIGHGELDVELIDLLLELLLPGQTLLLPHLQRLLLLTNDLDRNKNLTSGCKKGVLSRLI